MDYNCCSRIILIILIISFIFPVLNPVLWQFYAVALKYKLRNRSKEYKFFEGKNETALEWYKKLSCCNKLQFSYPHISATELCKPLKFQTYIIWSNRNHSLKYQRSTTFDCKDIEVWKSEFVAKTIPQFQGAYCSIAYRKSRNLFKSVLLAHSKLKQELRSFQS